MKSILLKALAISSILFLMGCQKVGGTITDSSGVNVAQANVTIFYTDENQNDINKSMMSSDEGEYLFEKLPENTETTVVVAKKGFVTQEGSIDTVKNEEVRLDFMLVPDDEPRQYGTVSGTITDIAGNPLAGVSVGTTGENAQTTKTCVNGAYTLLVEVSEHSSVVADLENYMQNSNYVTVAVDETSILDMSMVVVDKVAKFDASEDMTISTKGASVILTGSSYVNEDGTDYSGEVTAFVSYNRVSTVHGAKAFPGDFLGLDTNGSEVVLQSYGFIDVKLQGVNGEKLNISSEATLTYPKDSTIDTTPATIPLWYYDTEKGSWIEDGLATYDAATDTYSGSVTHFTTWNLDAKFDGAEFSGCVEDSEGNRVVDSTIFVNAQGWNISRQNHDQNGSFKFINVASGLEMSIKALHGGFMSNEQTFTLAAGEKKVFENCLVLENNVSDEYFSLQGQVVGVGTLEDNYKNTSIYIYEDNGEVFPQQYLATARLDENGKFLVEDMIRPTTNKIFIIGNLIRKKYLLDTSKMLTDIGVIEVKLTELQGCIVRADNNSSAFEGAVIAIDSPYISLYRNNSIPINADGTFTFNTVQDNLEHELFVHADKYSHVQSFSLTTNQDSVDLSDSCIVLEDASEINKNVTVQLTTSDDVHIAVASFDPHVGIQNDLVTSGKEASFNLTHNGVYYILVAADEENDGNGGFDYTSNENSITLTVDNVEYSLDFDENKIGWTHMIEVFQGNIYVHEINMIYGGDDNYSELRNKSTVSDEESKFQWIFELITPEGILDFTRNFFKNL